MDKTGISVIICTFNGEKQLINTFTHLFNQKYLEKINWEVIVVDNASTDNTSFLVKEIIKSHNNYRISLLYQSKAGKLEALKLAVSNAHFKYLLICDDDNWLCETYLFHAVEFMENNMQVGILGGNGKPVDLSSLPKWILPHLHIYAAAAQWPNSANLTHETGSVYGAGMVIRREIYQFVIKKEWPLFLSAMRLGKNLLSGEDTEICYIARLLGYEIHYNSELEFYHNLPTTKLNKEYLLKLVYFFGYGEAKLIPYLEIEEGKRFHLLKELLLEIYRLIRYDIFSLIKKDTISKKIKFYRRYGFIKSLFLNNYEIKNLRRYLNQNLKIGNSSHHF